MPILIAPDSFKECLSAVSVATAIADGIRSVRQDVELIIFPMADGGEGTTDILHFHLDGTWRTLPVHDPLQRVIESRYLLVDNNHTAVIELAKASGLELLRSEERNPLHTTTLGTGELIRHALENGARDIILTIGGSATVDGGTGLATALGFQFYNEEGNAFLPVGGTLGQIQMIRSEHIHQRLREVQIRIASDVQNVLTGPTGAARVYGPQKGADEQAVEILESGLVHLSALIEKATGFNADEHPGTGAAGGAALFLLAYGNAHLSPGFDLLAELTRFKESLHGADIIITGEGALDEQTKYGKVVSSIANYARGRNKTLIAVCGRTRGEPDAVRRELGIAQIFSVRSRAKNDEDSMENARTYLRDIGAEIAHTYPSK